MKILLTTTYLIDTDKNDFWDSCSGKVLSEIASALKKRFPQKLKLSNSMYGQRYSLRHVPIDYPNANLLICPVCGRPLTDRAKPNPIEGLDSCCDLAGILMCKSCAWELKRDVELYGIKHVMGRFES